MYYTYAYLREDGTPYYIGKGSGNRAYVPHKRKNGTDFNPKNKTQIIILKKFNEEIDAYKHEKYLIFLYGLKINNGILINMTNGGDGGGFIKYPLEERKKAYYEKYKERSSTKKFKERRLELERIRIRENREKHNNKSKKYYENNKEKCLEYAKKYREKNKEKINDAQQKRRNENKTKEREEQKKYKDKNREKIRKRDREYYAKNKEKIKQRKKELRLKKLKSID
jgi:hypothetical protein